MDADERRALSLQIAKGDELRRKVMGEDSGDDGSNDEAETEEDLLKKARDILAEKSDVTEESLGKRKGLFELEFMKRGMETQRARAKEEARRLLEELEANQMPTDSEDDSDHENGKRKKDVKPKVASEEETSKVLPDGKLMASSLEFGKSDSFAVSTATTSNGTENKSKSEKDQEDGHESNKKKRKKKKKSKGEEANGESQEEENPWMAVAQNQSSTPASKSSKSQPTKKGKSSLPLKVDINAAASMLVDAPEKGKKSQGSKNDVLAAEKENASKSSDAGLASLSQAELVKRAFASPDDLEAEEEFQQEKVCCLYNFTFIPFPYSMSVLPYKLCHILGANEGT